MNETPKQGSAIAGVVVRLIGIYVVTNVSLVMMTVMGIIHPPFLILQFFTFVGPIGGSIGAITGTLMKPKVLDWRSAIGIILFLGFCALINWQLYSHALSVV